LWGFAAISRLFAQRRLRDGGVGSVVFVRAVPPSVVPRARDELDLERMAGMENAVEVDAEDDEDAWMAAITFERTRENFDESTHSGNGSTSD
jgi:hypothetical protein